MEITKTEIAWNRISTEPAWPTPPSPLLGTKKKKTWAHTHIYKPSVEPSKYMEVTQLKGILIDLLETPKEVMETTPKAEIVDNILCKHMIQPKSPNLLILGWFFHKFPLIG